MMSGAPLRAGVITKPGTFVLLSGKPQEYRKVADSGAVRPQGFCGRCGTALYSTSDGDDPKAYNVRVGAVRQRNELVPRKQLFVRSQQAWVNDLGSIAKFDKMPLPPGLVPTIRLISAFWGKADIVNSPRHVR